MKWKRKEVLQFVGSWIFLKLDLTYSTISYKLLVPARSKYRFLHFTPTIVVSYSEDCILENSCCT